MKGHDLVEQMRRVQTRRHSSGLLAEIWPEVPQYEIDSDSDDDDPKVVSGASISQRDDRSVLNT